MNADFNVDTEKAEMCINCIVIPEMMKDHGIMTRKDEL